MIAVVPVRGGVLPVGGDEAVSEAGGRVLLVGDGTVPAANELVASLQRVWSWEAGDFRPGAWARSLAGFLAEDPVVILPASPDGRDLAPRLAVALGRPLLAGAVRVEPDRVTVLRFGGRAAEDVEVNGPIVATLQPGVRGVQSVPPGGLQPDVEILELIPSSSRDAETLEVLPPDPATMDLSEAQRIVAGGLGLASADAFALLREVATALGASPGATRAAADAGWAPSNRFIGTTGVIVSPRLYVALGISGAVQHVTGLGDPEHVISVNLDPSCPMMDMADLAIVADARALLKELALRLHPEVTAHA